MDLNVLLDYDHWANSIVFSSFSQLPESKERSEITTHFTHLMTAQLIWVNRINKEPLPSDIWPPLSIHEIEDLMQHNPP